MRVRFPSMPQGIVADWIAMFHGHLVVTSKNNHGECRRNYSTTERGNLWGSTPHLACALWHERGPRSFVIFVAVNRCLANAGRTTGQSTRQMPGGRAFKPPLESPGMRCSSGNVLPILVARLWMRKWKDECMQDYIGHSGSNPPGSSNVAASLADCCRPTVPNDGCRRDYR